MLKACKKPYVASHIGGVLHYAAMRPCSLYSNGDLIPLSMTLPHGMGHHAAKSLTHDGIKTMGLFFARLSVGAFQRVGVGGCWRQLERPSCNGVIFRYLF